jgi:uncharacterized protein YjiS (DUF1127 family)
MQTTIAAVQPHSGSSSTSLAKMLGEQIAATFTHYMTWRARRATKLLLKSLDDRTLADIGVLRTGIDAVVRDIELQRTRWYVG